MSNKLRSGKSMGKQKEAPRPDPAKHVLQAAGEKKDAPAAKDDGTGAGAGKKTGAIEWGKLISLNPKHADILLSGAKEVLFGRSFECAEQARFQDKRMSRRHCRIFPKLEDARTVRRTMVEDLSTKGTFVNGELVGKGNRVYVNDGDEITIIPKSEEGASTDSTDSNREDFVGYKFRVLTKRVYKPKSNANASATDEAIPEITDKVTLEHLRKIVEQLKVSYKPHIRRSDNDKLFERGVFSWIEKMVDVENWPDVVQWEHDLERVADMPSFLSHIMLLFDTDSIEGRNALLRLFTAISSRSLKSHAIVMAAFGYYKLKKGERTRFQTLMECFTNGEGGWQHKHSALQLISKLVSSPPVCAERVTLRTEFRRLGLEDIFNVFGNITDDGVKPILELIETYHNEKKLDDEEAEMEQAKKAERGVGGLKAKLKG